MAGTEGSSLRRWSSGRRTAAQHCGSQVVCGAGDVEPFARRWEKRPTRCDPKRGQRVGPQISWIDTDRLDAELDSCALEPGSLETSMLETDLLTVESEAGALETDLLTAESEDGALETDLLTVESEADVLENDQLTAVLVVRASSRRRRVGMTQRVRRAALRAGALFLPVGRRVRAEHSVQRAEAGSDFAAQFCSRDAPMVRLNRVNDILRVSQSRFKSRISQNSLTHNSHSTIARSLHAVHGARCVQNSSNSLGDGVVRGRGVCVPGETKSLSMSTRAGVRRSAVYGSAHTQQTPLKLHVETWEGLLRNQGPKIFREVEIVPGCAVRVACPSCPDYSPEPPGPGRIIGNMLGWSLLEITERSGVWVFRGALQGENLFFFP